MLFASRTSVLRQAQHHFRVSRSSNRSQHSALTRLFSSLAVLEQREGKLQNASLSAVTAAQKLGGSVVGIVAGSGIKAVAEEAAKVKGMEKVIMIENGAYDKVHLPPFPVAPATHLISGSSGKLRPSAR